MTGRIAIICGGCKPGCSGVGDYTLGLAAALRESGCDARIIAAMDPAVSDAVESTMTWRDQAIPSLRLPRSWRREPRADALRAWLEAFAPDWISWQFVPYAFHPKGIADRGQMAWSEPGKGVRHQVMFHEVWIGDHAGAPLRRRLWGIFQRRAIRRVMARLRPSVVHTGIGFHRHLLRKIGLEAKLLPIFGAISLTAPALGRVGGTLSGTEWTGGFFGTIHPNFPAARVFPALRTSATQIGRRLRVLSLGEAGSGGADFDRWAQHWPEIAFERRGPLPDTELSPCLAGLDFGLSSTPLNIVGKSSSVAALSEHGVPAICADLGSPTRGFQTPVDQAEPRAYLLERYLAREEAGGAARPPAGNRVAAVCAQFRKDLGL